MRATFGVPIVYPCIHLGHGTVKSKADILSYLPGNGNATASNAEI
eukprot:CAMPEP_0174297554 /NCGR_PEP_ID=MMETSP0809-20121228/51355_1 /TAXON_ID=73025 ORGANISM="Eutreptiella gymnastica-like, Strain CCMP1594" /NCGR_SAMPLE_ID=MMETSP0809 /ASSEMBLY_ACC=CAM_ASM_000658 /LENGTH=44 /DNA_ID= /DNA_START= /DNA_END= /DNA_ORIENTATION=